jgi:3',5'-cyclic AMP phosphodiesterase CpdA
VRLKLAILGDLHLISPLDPSKQIHQKRRHFADAWPSFTSIASKVRDESPDLVVCLGDLVDWYSPQNRDFAIERLNDLKVPWVATPGNHDFATYRWNDRSDTYDYLEKEDWELADQGWKERGVVFDNQIIDTSAGTSLILVNSAFSGVLEGTREWLINSLHGNGNSIIFTHVPLDCPAMRNYILSVDPGRNLTKYVQSRSPWLFDECIKGKVPYVYTGHLHLPGAVHLQGTTMHLLGLSTMSVGKEYPGMGKMAVLDLDRPESLRIV